MNQNGAWISIDQTLFFLDGIDGRPQYVLPVIASAIADAPFLQIEPVMAQLADLIADKTPDYSSACPWVYAMDFDESEIQVLYQGSLLKLDSFLDAMRTTSGRAPTEIIRNAVRILRTKGLRVKEH